MKIINTSATAEDFERWAKEANEEDERLEYAHKDQDRLEREHIEDLEAHKPVKKKFNFED